MKVLHITNNYPTERYPIYGIFVKEQIQSLSNLGVENEVFFINGRENGKLAYVKSIPNLAYKIMTEKYDVIHCHHALSGIVYLLATALFRPKQTCFLSYQNDPQREGGLILFKLFSKYFSELIVKNNDCPQASCGNVTYLPNGVDLDLFNNENAVFTAINPEAMDDNVKYILFMDSNDRRTQKRRDRFLETVELLRTSGLGVAVEPLILTNTPRHLVPSYIKKAALHVISSDFEGSPNSAKECLACNTPVVSTPVGNARDLLSDVPGCGVATSFDAKELAELCVRALNYQEFQGRRYIQEKGLDLETVARKLRARYESRKAF